MEDMRSLVLKRSSVFCKASILPLDIICFLNGIDLTTLTDTVMPSE